MCLTVSSGLTFQKKILILLDNITVKPEIFTTFLFSRLSRIRKIREIKKSEKIYLYFISDNEVGGV